MESDRSVIAYFEYVRRLSVRTIKIRRRKMLRTLTLVVLVAALTSCQTVQLEVGKGPIPLSSRVTTAFEKYKNLSGPGLFIVSPNGRTWGYSYCGDGSGACQNNPVHFDVASKCEKASGQKCYVFAERGFVVWDGKVTFNSTEIPRRSATVTQSRSDDTICKFATKLNGSTREWEDASFHAMAIAIEEAKARGLTIEKCANILGDARTTQAPSHEPQGKDNLESVEKSLETVQRLLDRGLVSKEEADKKRSEILARIK